MPGARFDQDVGSPSFQRVLQITSTPQKITILGTRYKTIEIYNADALNTIYFGDAGVLYTTGMPFFAGSYRFFKGAFNAFQVWMVCGPGQTANVNILEYP